MVKKLFFTSLTLVVVLAIVVFFLEKRDTANTTPSSVIVDLQTSPQSVAPSPTIAPTQPPQPTLPPVPVSKILPTDYHVFQTFNNCGPASLSMALSHFGIRVSQEELRDSLRPYHNPQGDNDDKSVTLDELAQKAREYGFSAYHLPGGNPDMVKQFIAHDMPVITETLLKIDDDIGHYRVIKGYDDTTREYIQDDSLQGKNLRYSYDDFAQLWKVYSYGFVVLIPQGKESIALQILGDHANYKVAWTKAVQQSEQELARNPNDVTARFNLSIGLYNIGQYQRSVEEFEKVEHQLPFRTLWYQIEPILAYNELGNDQRVFQLTDQILNNHNRAFSELYIIRGNIYKRQGNLTAARAEYEKAVLYNRNLKAAQDALNSI
jgi:tetratricopeptide (TPR) repeat protein